MHKENKYAKLHRIDEQAPVNSIIEVRDLCVSADKVCIFNKATLGFERNTVTTITGPSGAGKSTFLKCLNRLIDFTPELQVIGDVLLNGMSIRSKDVDADELRSRIATLFQQPVIFPGSIAKNVLFGIRHQPGYDKKEAEEIVETALKSAAIWEEVKDRLTAPASQLSVGQRQRLCLARILAMEPDVILMDEPTSALDPKATAAIEELIQQLKGSRTIIMVTHDEAQAGRVAEKNICFTVTDGACCIEAGIAAS
ncbi:phosphate import ATP-binding protein PstB [Oceaniferula spumae]|uniref:Phosphate import ATP-binding protein PstB n=1 Tax=Oceaniferula spumae TaxID=2979115 RepID=A0AAT9FQR4_9BACT